MDRITAMDATLSSLAVSLSALLARDQAPVPVPVSQATDVLHQAALPTSSSGGATNSTMGTGPVPSPSPAYQSEHHLGGSRVAWGAGGLSYFVSVVTQFDPHEDHEPMLDHVAVSLTNCLRTLFRSHITADIAIVWASPLVERIIQYALVARSSLDRQDAWNAINAYQETIRDQSAP